MVTLVPVPLIGRADAASTAAPAGRAARWARTASWWKWLDFDSEVLAQIWLICCVQIAVLTVGGLVLHASSASPY